jgi:hypothetical protein
MTTPDDGTPVQLLRLLGHLYSQHGDTTRGVVLLLLAARLAPKNAGVWRTLVHAFLADGAPERAISAIERLRLLEGADHPVLDLLMARALWACGRPVEARRSLREFLERRNQS